MSSIFYDKFERHAHGEGLKARATHYCPGCGHGLAHKYLADAIEKLGDKVSARHIDAWSQAGEHTLDLPA